MNPMVPTTPPAVTFPDHDGEDAVIAARSSWRPQRIELLRWVLLQEAAKVSAHGLPASTYHLAARLRGLEATLAEVERELDYLLGKKLLAAVPRDISPEIGWHAVTAEGTDLLAEYKL